MVANISGIPTTRTLTAMFAAGYSGSTSYNRLYHAVLDGKIPAKPGANGRPLISPNDFPVVAEVLGLQAPAEKTAA